MLNTEAYNSTRSQRFKMLKAAKTQPGLTFWRLDAYLFHKQNSVFYRTKKAANVHYKKHLGNGV